MPKQKKKQPAEAAERMHFGFRVTPEMKQRIESAAAQSGRSMSQEVEFRLERSIDREDLLSDVLELKFGPEVAGLLLAIGIAMDNGGRRANSLLQALLRIGWMTRTHMTRPRERSWGSWMRLVRASRSLHPTSTAPTRSDRRQRAT